MAEKPRLVIDTDVGSDDAMALILCVAAEMLGEVDILGITCVHGNTSLRNVCVNTLKTLDTMNRLDIPVYRGAKTSLVQSFERASNIHGKDGFGDFTYPNPPDVESTIQKLHAVNYLINIADELPGEITLLTLGPLTNIALAIRMDPNFATKIKHIIIMGGNNEGVGNITAAAEFNFYCDPEAAHIVIHNMTCPITLFPWETAYRHGKIPYDWRKNILGKSTSAQSQLMAKVERVILEGELYGAWHRCDPMAAALAIKPDIVVESERRYATVELRGHETRGALVVDHLDKLGRPHNVTIVQKLDLERYKVMLLKAFSLDMKGNTNASCN